LKNFEVEFRSDGAQAAFLLLALNVKLILFYP
jgi:hypothetical protein